MVDIFSTQHMWDSLYQIPLDQHRIDTVIRGVRQEYDMGLLPFLSFPHFHILKQQFPLFTDFFYDKKYLIVIGIGGSCIGIKALVQLLSAEQDFTSDKKIYFAENVDAYYMARVK